MSNSPYQQNMWKIPNWMQTAMNTTQNQGQNQGGNMWQIPMLPPNASQQPMIGPQLPQPQQPSTGGGGSFMQSMMPGGDMFNKMSNMWKIKDPGTGGGGGGSGLLGGLSGFMEHAAGPLGIGLSLASSVIGFKKAKKAQRKAEKQAKASERERQRQEEAYRNLDTSNPYLNMENTMEDLTINQKQFQLESQQAQQSEANILDSLKGAAGGSGVAALAQQMAQSGQLGAQSRAARIGQQESANQMAERRMDGQIQGMEREGDIWSRGQEQAKTETLFGMAQQKAAADNAAVAQAKQAKMDALTGGLTGAADMFAGFGQ